ncbi:MAG TPA: T9SS type A sorting domain-containing protein [Bacteroidia bacterium]|nr:T9SS type A sorting domain-containing protein [Bacteroidia bacterium]
MKKFNFITLFYVFSNLTFAQTWCAPGAEWLYRVYNPSFLFHQDGLLRVKVDSSYVQAGINYYVLNGTFYGTTWQPGAPSTTISNMYRATTYEINKVVYVSRRDYPIFDTLANFNAAIGDKWLKSNLYNDCPPTYTPGIQYRMVTVIDTGHVIINNVSLKKLILSLHPASTTNTITMIEKIACLETFMYPYYFCVSDDWDLGKFACYSDHNFPTYKNPNYTLSCDYTSVGTYEAELSEKHFNIFPNPVTGRFLVLLPEGTQVPVDQLTVLDPTGRKIMEKTISEPCEIDLSPYQSGLYHILLSSGGQIIATRKLIKSRN